MITYIRGDLFESPAKVLVNTVNTKGVMGKGIALRFKKIYPEMFKIYRDYCESGQMDIGNLLLYKTPHKWILNFPTKRHWKNPSHVEYVESGLSKFVESYVRMGITSIAFPALGCGNGELDYETQVKPLMERYLGKLSIPVLIYTSQHSTSLPEHKDTDRTRDWLRSDPSALPFDEVWEDILNILNQNDEFLTCGKGNPFTAHATTDPPRITIKASGKTSQVFSDELVEFWKQLRDYGITHSSIAPERRQISYLLPLFAKLSYVKLIAVSASAKGLETNPAAGLQVIPPPLSKSPNNEGLFGNYVKETKA